MKKSFLYVFALLLISACHSTNEKINKAGEVVGETAGNIVKGVTTGVDKAYDVKVEVPQSLQDKGLSLGKISISSDSSGSDNKLTMYMIFAKDFNQTVMVKVFDNKDAEMGRARLEIIAKKDDARFVDFVFDSRTNIDHDSKITIE